MEGLGVHPVTSPYREAGRDSGEAAVTEMTKAALWGTAFVERYSRPQMAWAGCA